MAISLIIAGVYAGVEGWQLAAIGPIPREEVLPSVVPEQITGYFTLFLVFLGSIGLVMLAAGVVLAAPQWRKEGLNFRGIALLGGSGLVVLVAAWFVGVNVIRADMTMGWSQALGSLGRPEASLIVAHRAIEEMPGSGLYRRMLAQDLLARLQSGAATEPMDDMMTEAEAQLQEAVRLSRGEDGSLFDLGHFYLFWAAAESGEKRADLAEKSARAFDQEEIHQPGYEPLWTERAILARFYLNRAADAQRYAEKAQELAHQVPSSWGDFYRDKALATSLPDLQRAYVERALECYTEQPPVAPLTPDGARTLVSMGILYEKVDDTDKALNCYLDALKVLPEEEAWQVEMSVVQIYRERNDLSGVLQHLDSAISKAPADKKPTLLELKSQLEQGTP